MILMSSADLTLMVKTAVREVIKEQNHSEVKHFPELLDIDNTIEWLKTNGYKISKSHLYNLNFIDQIPVKKFGKSLMFNRDQILDWAKNRVTSKSKSIDDSVKEIAKSANRKKR